MAAGSCLKPHGQWEWPHLYYFSFVVKEIRRSTFCVLLLGVSWVVQQGEMVVGTSLVAVVQNGLSQLHGVTSRARFTVAMIRGLAGNLTLPSREAFAKQVIIYTHYVCMFTFPTPVTHVCACVCLYIYMCVCVCVCVCARACMCIITCAIWLYNQCSQERDRELVIKVTP